MDNKKTIRAMWLLNHTSARKFEIPMLKRMGINQIFLPKNFPSDPSFRSASIDWSEDEHLEIPPSDLTILNEADWYSGATLNAWTIANKYFDVIFFIIHDINILYNVTKYFNGIIVWRAYGLDKTLTYTKILNTLTNGRGNKTIRSIGRRFFFGEAYPHLADIEDDFIKERRCYLPLGLNNTELNDQWIGSNRKIFFVCPDIGFNPYYHKIYEEFIENFGEFKYSIGGAQPISVENINVLGFTPFEVHKENMREMRVMFYHSTEPRHIHYHPFEAIRAGMPLIFMAGGMLDRMGGVGLPGRCTSIEEAKAKIKRILEDDWSLINDIKATQSVLLMQMKPENCINEWKTGINKILKSISNDHTETEKRPRTSKKKRIAVIVPVGYRGGSLRGAKLLAQAILLGSQQSDQPCEVVLAHLDDTKTYPEEEFTDFPTSITRRAFQWKTMSASAARRAMRYAGYNGWEPSAPSYIVPDDGIKQLMDCDLWLMISDRLAAPVLPIRPISLMVYDYLQRYVPIMTNGIDQGFIDAARQADQVLITTNFTMNDALQYAGVDIKKISKVPMLAPDFSNLAKLKSAAGNAFFIWTTNAALHKNHANTAKALRIYYEDLGGKLLCIVSGVNSESVPKGIRPHHEEAARIFRDSELLKKHVVWKGELPDDEYRKLLANASFLLHAGQIDNGTFSVIEAAWLGVPSLSSDYPAMQEINSQFDLNLAWMDANSPTDMARQLKYMEENIAARRTLLPSTEQLSSQSIEALAGEYWKVVRQCL